MKRFITFTVTLASTIVFLSTPLSSHATVTVSGDIICEWEHFHTTSKARKLRGSGAYHPKHHHEPIPTNEFYTQVDLFLDYDAEKSYAKIQFQFENTAGIFANEKISHKKKKNFLTGSAELDNISLYKAYMGYHLMQKDFHTFDLELGRRPLYDAFDSKIQFESNFDGLLFSYWRQNDKWGAFNGKLAGFVVDQLVNQFGYIGELDFYAIRGSKLDIKYSLISWQRHGHNRYDKRYPLGSRFLNSQLLFVYGIDDLLGIDPSIYLAGLHNHAATANHFTHHKKANNAFYGGITLGKVQKKNDWSLDLNYQYVQAQSIPQDDVSGIGRDNPLDLSFYKYRWAGNTNYQGYCITYIYGLTDNISLTLLYQDSHAASRRIGGKFHSSSLQLSTTFTF